MSLFFFFSRFLVSKYSQALEPIPEGQIPPVNEAVDQLRPGTQQEEKIHSLDNEAKLLKGNAPFLTQASSRMEALEWYHLKLLEC